ncbi:MAG: CDP-alcohol phosphatidyltransferase family protein [Kiloniellales bacterium]
MLDPLARRLIDPPLGVAASHLVRVGLSANAVTVAGFAVGLGAAGAIAFEHYLLGLLLFALNRLADGLDGAIARIVGKTDLGGYLDIVLDFLVYGAIVLGFAAARPENALPATLLLASYIGTGSTFLTFAILAAKHGIETRARGSKSLYYLGGLTEGTETIAFTVAVCLWPDGFPLLATLFAAACLITTASRIAIAVRTFR